MTPELDPQLEALRLQILHQYGILDTDPEPLFDDLTEIAAQICDTPIALISLIDQSRQWFKSKVGIDVCETSREVAFCDHTIQQADVLVVPDTHADERFAQNPLVTAAPHIRFYAGAPLINAQGYALGTLCVIDRTPRDITPEQVLGLKRLSRQVMSQLDLRRTLFDLTNQMGHLQIAIAEVQQTRQDLEQQLTQYTSALAHTNQDLQEQVRERHRAELALQQANEVLEQRVLRRTADLAQINAELQQEIAERQHAEAERDRLFNLSLDLLCIADTNGYFRRVNPAFVRRLGYTEAELLDQPFIAWVHECDRSATRQEVAKLKDGIPTIYFENRYRCRNGSYCWLAWTAYPHAETGTIYAVARDMTAQKRVEQERIQGLQREQQARAEAETARRRVTDILESITDAFFALDREWRFTYVNAQAERLLQRQRSELLQQNIWQEFPEAVNSIFQQQYERAVNQQSSVTFEAFYPPLDTWYLVHAYPAQTGLSVYFQDISQRKQAEMALRHSEERYRLLFESNPQPMWVFDINTLKFLAVNEAAIRHYGYAAAEFAQMTVLDIRFPEDVPLLLRQFAQFPDGLTTSGIWRHRKRDGTAIQVEITSHTLNFAGRKSALVLANDVTERLRAETQLLETSRLQQAILDGANYTIIATDIDGTIQLFNHAAEQLLGYGAAEMIGQKTPAIIHDSQEVAQRAAELSVELGTQIQPGFEVFVAKSRRGQSEEREWTYISRDGQRIPVLLSVTALRDADGNITGFLGIGRDITERKQAEASQRRLVDILEAAADFIGMVNAAGQTIYLNQAGRQMIGFDPTEDLSQVTVADYCPDWAAKIVLEEGLPTTVQTGKWAGEIALQRQDGAEIPASQTIVVHRNGNGEVESFSTIIRDIRDRKQMEEALRDSEERWQLALKGNNDGIWDWNAITNEVFFSSRWKEMLGYRDDEVANHLSEWESRVHPDDIGWVKQALQDHFAQKTPFYITEHRVRCKDGTYKWILDRGQALWDEQGRVVRVVGSHTDITERRRAENILRNIARGVAAETGAAFFSSLTRYLTKALKMDYACIGELVQPECDRIQTIAFHGQGRALPNRQYPLGGTPCATVIEAAKLQVYAEGLSGQFPADSLVQSVQAECYVGAPVMDANGRILGVIAVFGHQKLEQTQLLQEVIQIFAVRAGAELERRQAETLLQRQNLRSRLFAEISLKIRQSLKLEAVLHTSVTEVRQIFQADRVLIFQVFADQSGQVVQEAVAPGWNSLLDLTVDDACFDDQYLELHRHGRCYTLDTIRQEEDGDCLYNFMEQCQVQSKLVMPIVLKQTFWGLLIVHQCSYQRQWSTFETELVQELAGQIGIALTQAQLLQQETQQRQDLARSNADLEQFAYVASHDLQEPLRMVVSYLQLIQRRYQGQLDQDADEFIHYAVDGANRMQTLIQDLLSYSRVGTRGRAFQWVDGNWIVDQALANLRSTVEYTHAQIEIADLPDIMVDRTQFVQLFQNLLSNALKFHGDAVPQIHISATSTATEHQFRVQDQGIGIAPDYRDRIFLIFQRLHSRSEYPGTGIGLALCKKIVERHGGQIWVESEPGQGSTFHFTVPIPEAA